MQSHEPANSKTNAEGKHRITPVESYPFICSAVKQRFSLKAFTILFTASSHGSGQLNFYIFKRFGIDFIICRFKINASKNIPPYKNTHKTGS
ncbi:MAG: hypothetical protein HOP02_07680 [Methylococcaceae bacterium]|nr:hypothetical protein [Methylococcaceae bacterium]